MAKSITENEKNNKEIKQAALLRNGRALVALLRAFLYDEPAVLPPDFSWEGVFSLACKHSVAAVLYKTAKASGCDGQILQGWENYKNQCLRKSMLFNAERKQILSDMDKLGVESIPLKGVFLCEYYPEPLLREFADNDILFHDRDTKTVREYMLDRGYQSDHEYRSDVHDEYKKPPIYNFEWHRRLLPTTQEKSLCSYFDGVWERAVRDENGKLRFCDEDFYLYFLAHLKKHAEEGGVGLRAYADYRFLTQGYEKKSEAEKVALLAAAKKSGLYDYEQEFKAEYTALLEENTLSDGKLLYVLSNGTYGTEAHKASQRIEKKGKASYFFYRAFPPMGRMVYDYPILRKFPVLLPVFWVYRYLRLFNPNVRKTMKKDLYYLKQKKEEE